MYDPASSGYADASGDNALQNFNDDMTALFGDIPPSSLWLTRLEGQLSRAALAADLQVGASADQSQVQGHYLLTKSIGTPPACPVNNCGSGSSGGPSPGFGTFGSSGGPVAQGGTCAMGHAVDNTASSAASAPSPPSPSPAAAGAADRLAPPRHERACRIRRRRPTLRSRRGPPTRPRPGGFMYGPQGNPTKAPPVTRPRKITVPEIRARKGGPPITMVTAYDFTMALLLDEGGADIVLVGDSLGMVVQGLPNTLPVTVDEICYHGRAVARGAPHAHVVGDMPFMSFQVSAERGLENAGKMIKEGGFESIKLEGGEEVAEHVRRIVLAGIPVMGHVGLTPQSVHAMGGFKVQGKDEEAYDRVVDGARALEEAGAFAIVLEAIPPDLAAKATASISIPTIGIGAGPSCDGQVLVCYDMLGMYPDLKPKFAKRFAEVGEQIIAATRAYVGEVGDRTFPAAEHTFKPSGIRRAPPSDPHPGHAAPAASPLPPADEYPPHWQTH